MQTIRPKIAYFVAIVWGIMFILSVSFLNQFRNYAMIFGIAAFVFWVIGAANQHNKEQKEKEKNDKKKKIKVY